MNALISSTASYGFIEPEDWEEPSWIDKEKAEQERENADYLYGHSQSYRRMCRYQSGGFYRHPLMQSYDFYWRLEPSVRFFCDIQEDPFLHMSQHNKVGPLLASSTFCLLTVKISRTVGRWLEMSVRKLYPVQVIHLFGTALVLTLPDPTALWDTTKGESRIYTRSSPAERRFQEFIKKNPQFVADNNGMGFVSDDEGETYNLCRTSMFQTEKKLFEWSFRFLEQFRNRISLVSAR